MLKQPAIVWFRNDLRLTDNPALASAAQSGRPIIAVYVREANGPLAAGGAARWWLHHSLISLGAALEARGSTLTLLAGDGAETIERLVSDTRAGAVYWNRRYAGAQIASDRKLMATLKKQGCEVHSFNGSLLREPWEVETKTGGHYRVFTPFWRSLQSDGPRRQSVLPAPETLPAHAEIAGERLKDWNLLPQKHNWAAEFPDHWSPGEAGAAERLSAFLNGPVNRYGEERNRPDLVGTSRLSPHLAFGETSPLQVWQASRAAIGSGKVDAAEGDKFLSEIAWREFSYNLLYHFPDLADVPMKNTFGAFPWRDATEDLDAWRQGRTGIPIVDAGMRELWRTGWIHNRVRMIVASFLCKNLLIDWRHGERWFWDTLLDADPANNAASWQWVAGSGADAAPYFRIFNPVTQGEKFDPEGDYVRRFVPELAGLPARCIHQPWAATAEVLAAAGIRLGESYPHPIADLAETRRRALAAYDIVRGERLEED